MAKSVFSYQRAKTNMANSKMDSYYDFEQPVKHDSFTEEQESKLYYPHSRPFSAKKW